MILSKGSIISHGNKKSKLVIANIVFFWVTLIFFVVVEVGKTSLLPIKMWFILVSQKNNPDQVTNTI